MRDLMGRSWSCRLHGLPWLAAIATLISLPGCFGVSEDISDPTANKEPVDHEVRVIFRNIGDGAGQLNVIVQAGTVANSCPARLGPGQTCSVEVKHTSAIPAATIVAEPDDISIFAEFRGDCESTTSECTVSMLETTVTVQVDVVFNLAVARIDFDPDPVTIGTGAEATLTAVAFADVDGETPVPGAAFAWESSNDGVVTVRAAGGGSATVSAVAAGEAWIRATARNRTDSVRVAITGHP